MSSVLKYLYLEGHYYGNRAINFCDAQGCAIHPATLKHPVTGHSLYGPVGQCRRFRRGRGRRPPGGTGRAAQVSANNPGAPRNQSRGVCGPGVCGDGTPQSRLWEMNCEGTPFSSSFLSDGQSALTRLHPPGPHLETQGQI